MRDYLRRVLEPSWRKLGWVLAVYQLLLPPLSWLGRWLYRAVDFWSNFNFLLENGEIFGIVKWIRWALIMLGEFFWSTWTQYAATIIGVLIVGLVEYRRSRAERRLLSTGLHEAGVPADPPPHVQTGAERLLEKAWKYDQLRRRDETRPVQAPPRAYLTQTPSDLAGLYKIHTDLQVDRLKADYIQKWMRVTGTVANVRQLTLSDQVRVRLRLSEAGEPAPHAWIHADFPAERGALVSHLKVGDALSVEGRVEDFSDSWVTLRDCEIAAQLAVVRTAGPSASFVKEIEARLAEAYTTLEGVLQAPRLGGAEAVYSALTVFRQAFRNQESEAGRDPQIRELLNEAVEALNRAHHGIDIYIKSDAPNSVKAINWSVAHDAFASLKNVREKLIRHLAEAAR